MKVPRASPRGFREQGSKRKIKLGTRKQKRIIGKSIGNTKIEEILLWNTGTQRKFVGNKGTWTPPGRPSVPQTAVNYVEIPKYFLINRLLKSCYFALFIVTDVKREIFPICVRL